MGQILLYFLTSLNVIDFGADPSGNTDSSSAFRQALDQSQLTGELIEVPSGNFKLLSWKPYSYLGRLKITGIGRDKSKIFGKGSFITLGSESSLEVEGASFLGFSKVLGLRENGHYQNLTVKNCHFQDISEFAFGTGLHTTARSAGNIEILNNSANKLGNGVGQVEDTGFILLRLDRAGEVRVERNLIESVGSYSLLGSAFGVHLRLSAEVDSNNRSYISFNTVDDVTNNSKKDTGGIMVLGGQAEITNNTISNLTGPLNSTDSEGIYIKTVYSKVHKNTLINAGGNEGSILVKGMDLGEKASSTNGDLRSHSNIISSNSIYFTKPSKKETRGISVTTSNCSIIDNSIYGSQVGIDVWSGTKGSRIKGNIIRSLKSGNPNKGVFGIRLANPNLVTVRNNTVSDLNGNGVSAAYGIFIFNLASEDISSLLLKNNVIIKIFGPNSRGIALNIRGQGQSVSIINNSISMTGKNLVINGKERLTKLEIEGN